jgi:NAD(P)-dependent dehydrogenase (short-subunit alcohol dehydrogenase family)
VSSTFLAPGLFAGRSAVVTGASLGIGASTVRMFAEQGATVAFCARSDEGVKQLMTELDGLPGTVRGYTADMADAGSTNAFLDSVENDVGNVDILVNNVGQSPSRNFLYMTDDDWDSLFQLNLMSAVRCTRRFLPLMRKQRWGRVVMVSTGSAKTPNAATIDYAASKAAMVSVGKALARKYGADNVLVNSILPGLIRTPMWERAAGEIADAGDGDKEAVFAARSKGVALGRYGTADEVANVIVFLCTDAASYVNGAAIEIDGGLSSGMF